MLLAKLSWGNCQTTQKSVVVISWWVKQYKRKGTLFKCLVVLALEHQLGTMQLKLTINTIKSNFGFWGEGKPEYLEKTSGCRVDNQQTQPTFDTRSGNQTWAISVGGEGSYHCAITAPLLMYQTTPCSSFMKMKLTGVEGHTKARCLVVTTCVNPPKGRMGYHSILTLCCPPSHFYYPLEDGNLTQLSERELSLGLSCGIQTTWPPP